MELEILGRLVEEARAGTTHFVVVDGEPGMGKSRLLDEVVAHPAAFGFSLHRARAEELQPRPFGLLAEALGIHSGSSDPDRLAIAQLLDADTAGETLDRRYRVIEGILNVIERHAIAGPVLLVLDDLHWADPSSAQALDVMSRRLDYLPLLVLMAGRPLPRPPELARLLDTVAEVGGRHLHLEALADEAVTELATARLEAAPGPGLRTRLEGAAGNPFFVLELLDALYDEGVIEVTGDVAEATMAIEPSPSLRTTVLRRLAFLSPASLEILRRASVLGGSFSAAQLSLVTGQPLLDVLSALEEPTMAGFVTASGETFAFRHDVVREALYLELPPAVRKGLHLHAGRTLAAAGASPAEVANHLALGAEFGDREAVAWLRRAARELRSRAPAMAVQLLERASSLLPAEDPDWAALVREQARTLAVGGWVREADALASRALTEVTDPVNGLQLSLTRLGLFVLQSRFWEARDLAENLLGYPSLPTEVVAELTSLLGVARIVLGDLDGALDLAAQLRPFADAHPTSQMAAWYWALIGRTDWARGYLGRGLGPMEKAVAASAGSSHRLGQTLLYLGAAQLAVDRFDEAAATFDRARIQLERLGNAAVMQEYHWCLAQLLFLAGRWDDALAEMATSRHLTEETGAGGVRFAVGSDPSPLIQVYRGDLPAARDAFATVEADPGTANSALATASWMEPMRALVQEAAGRPAEALRTLETWHGRIHEMTLLPDYRGVARAVAQIFRASEKADWLERISTEANEMARRAGGVSSVDGTALLLRGMLEKDPEPLLAAVEAFRAAPRPFDRAEACAEAGVALLARGQETEGRALATEAFEVYEELDASRCEAALAQEMRPFGIRRGARGRRQRAVSGWSALTATEERIIALVAEGLTNGEIGERLYISRGTVATHLRSVFRKLAVASRAELAAEAARRLP